MSEEYIDVAQAAQELGLGQSTVWLLMKRANLPRYRIPGAGKRTFIRRSDLARLKEPVRVDRQEPEGKAAA